MTELNMKTKEKYDIPANNYTDAVLIDCLVNEIMTSMKERDDYGYLRAIDYPKETLCKVLNIFYEKGYFCYYRLRYDGAWIAIMVSGKPICTGSELTLNRTIKYSANTL